MPKEDIPTMTLPHLELPEFEPGWVWLTGAGPGDPALLTALALHGLAHTDVVVYDALVHPSILSLARPGAEAVYAGKRGGKPSTKQKDICARLVEFAGQGKRVLRLKGGDPFVFGRGAEEGLALVAAGVPFRIIPGISSGVGGLAYAGIPLTHRETSSSVTFITGHDLTGTLPHSLDWAAVAGASKTLVVYMPLKNLAQIVQRLIAGGRPPDEPIALISRAAPAEQHVVTGTLCEAARLGDESGISPPALFVVGEVVKLRDGLDWLGAAAGKALDPAPLSPALIRDAG